MIAYFSIDLTKYNDYRGKNIFYYEHIIKTRLHNRMRWMNDCLVKYIERDLFDKIDNEVIMYWFQNMKSRRRKLWYQKVSTFIKFLEPLTYKLFWLNYKYETCFYLSIRRKLWLSVLKFCVLDKKRRFEVTLHNKKIRVRINPRKGLKDKIFYG